MEIWKNLRRKKTGLLENAKNSKEDVEKKQHDIAEIQKIYSCFSDSMGQLNRNFCMCLHGRQAPCMDALRKTKPLSIRAFLIEIGEREVKVSGGRQPLVPCGKCNDFFRCHCLGIELTQNVSNGAGADW